MVKKVYKVFNQKPFDLLLIDLEMPEMDCTQMIKEIRKTNNQIPALAFTATAYENIFSDLLQKGFSAFVPKNLNAAIADLLEL
jgi:two-component system capsular synthesis sensor histidine kinase RcsC